MRTSWTLTVVVVLLLSSCGTSDTVQSSVSSTPSTSTATSNPSTPIPTSTTAEATATSLTAATAVEPPLLEVTDPVNGALVGSKRVQLRGRTDPGCTVDVGGRYFADVDPDGNWTMGLVLHPGDNSTTLTAIHPETGLETTQSLQIRYEPGAVLNADGLGVATFGDPMDDVRVALTDLFGPPSSEQAMEAPFDGGEGPGGGTQTCNTAVGYPCFDSIRFLIWDDVGLSVVIGDWEVARTGDDDYEQELVHAAPNLRGYTYWGGDASLTLYTATGITIGSTVEDLAAAFGNALGFGPRCGEILEFYVTIDAEGLIGIRGELSGVHLDPAEITIETISSDTQVLSISAGPIGNC